MGNDKRKRTKQCRDSDISDFDDSTQPPTTLTNDTSAQHFPRFILVESKKREQTDNIFVPVYNTKSYTKYSWRTLNIKKLQHFPRFILFESKKENRQITSLSPFVIQKVIQSIAGEP